MGVETVFKVKLEVICISLSKPIAVCEKLICVNSSQSGRPVSPQRSTAAVFVFVFVSLLVFVYIFVFGFGCGQ